MDIHSAAQAIVDRLTAAGVRAVLDARDANPPCVLVRAPTLTYRYNKGGYDAAWTVWVLVPDTGRAQTMKAFGPLLDKVQTAIDHAAQTATPDDAVMPDGSTIPVYQLTWTERIC